MREVTIRQSVEDEVKRFNQTKEELKEFYQLKIEALEKQISSLDEEGKQHRDFREPKSSIEFFDKYHYERAYLSTMLKFTELTKESIIKQISDVEYCTNDIVGIIRELRRGNLLAMDEWSNGIDTQWIEISLCGKDIIRALIRGYYLKMRLYEDTYRTINGSKNVDEKRQSVVNILGKAKEITNSEITRRLLEDEINKIGSDTTKVSEQTIYKTTFYSITNSLSLFRKNDKEKIQNISNGIIKEFFVLTRSKNYKITETTSQIKYHNLSFWIYN